MALNQLHLRQKSANHRAIKTYARYIMLTLVILKRRPSPSISAQIPEKFRSLRKAYKMMMWARPLIGPHRSFYLI